MKSVRIARAVGIGALALVMLNAGITERDLADAFFCISLTTALALALAVASGRIAFGCVCAASAVGTLLYAAKVKLTYLHEPLLASDVRYLRGALADVVRHYPRLLGASVLALTLMSVGAIVAWRSEASDAWRGRRKAQAAAMSASLLLLLACLSPQGPFRQVHAVPAWDVLQQAQRDPLTTFTRSFARMGVAAPPHEGDADAYDWGAAREPARRTPRPDIVAVLEESTLDPRQWSACMSPRCDFAMFGTDAATRAHGLLKVHTYGGGTWTSEFAFFTGLPHSLFGPAGIYAPYNLAPRVHESLAAQLKALGYHTIAVYPMPRNFVRAAGAYADYGFDEFHDAQELGLRWESTDFELFEHVKAIHRRAREDDARPMFLMVLTMRQHGPHDEPLDGLPPPWNEEPAPTLEARANRNLGTYLYRMHQSDQALADLRRYLFDADRPIVFAHFGDHHPSFDGLETGLATTLAFSSSGEASSLTYYRIDSNVAGETLRPGEPLDIAFLGGLLLDVAGLPKDAYFEANTRLRARCGGRFDDCTQTGVLDSFLAYTFGRLKIFDE